MQRLVLFRSLVASPHQRGCIAKQIATTGSPASSWYDGVELSLSQAEQTPSFLGLCSHHNLRAVCRMDAADAADAGRKFDRLSTVLARAPSDDDSSATVELVVLNNLTGGGGASADAEVACPYLREALPLAAQFLESHPTVGRSHGIRDAHGNPVGRHLLGVCHGLGGSPSLDSLSVVLDVLPPTRLSLNVADLSVESAADGDDRPGGGGAGRPCDGATALATVVEKTDHIYSHARGGGLSVDRDYVWENLWDGRRLAGAIEVYATLIGDDYGAKVYAEMLRDRFERWNKYIMFNGIQGDC